MLSKRFQFPPMLGPPDDEPAGTPAWAMRVAAQVEMYVEKVDQFGVDHLCRYLTKILNEPVRPWDVWPEGNECQTLDAFFQLCCGRTYEQIHALISGYLGDAELTRKLNSAKARADAQHRKRGRPRKDASKNPTVSRDSYLDKQGPETVERLLRRIAGKKDGEAILERYERGEFATVRDAADAAKIPRGDSPIAVIKRAWKKLSKEERATLRAELPE